MKAGRGILGHVALLILSVVAAVYVWTRDKQPKSLVQADVTVWATKPADVQSIAYESKSKKVALEGKSDAAGRYFEGTFEKRPVPPAAAADGGAPPPPAEPAAPTTITIVSVGGAEKLLADLAPLKAFRSVGKIGDDRAAEFGFDDPDGTLTVQSGGAAKKLVLGGQTPGGADRYVREDASGEVYVIKGDIVRALDSADARLVERDLHEWKDNDVDSARITAGDKARDVVRGSAEGKKFWADPSNTAQSDETLANWITKLDRLRPNEYVLTPPAGAETVVRIEYKAGNKTLGFLEIDRVPGAAGAKPDYYVLSERIRHHAKVTASLAEQVEQDLASIVK